MIIVIDMSFVLGDLSMKKGKKNMYGIVLQTRRQKSIYDVKKEMLSVPESGELVKYLVSKRVVDSLSDDMQRVTDLMVETILEGLVHGR